MRKIFMMIAILSVVTIVATAQSFSPAQPDNQVFQSQQVMQGGAYRGTVYEPFSTTTPSEQSVVGASHAPANAPGPRRTFDHGGDSGQSEEYPIGDGMIPLLLCAGVFCGVVYYRRRKALKS